MLVEKKKKNQALCCHLFKLKHFELEEFSRLITDWILQCNQPNLGCVSTHTQ